MNCTFCRIFIQRQDANHSRRGGWQSLWVPSTVVSIVPWISGIIHFSKDLAWGFLISVEQSLLSIWRILCWKVGSKYCKEDPWRKSEWMLQHLVSLKILSITSPQDFISASIWRVWALEMAGCLLTMRRGEFQTFLWHRILGNTFSRYANYLYSSGLLDANQRDECLAMEEITQSLIKEGNL